MRVVALLSCLLLIGCGQPSSAKPPVKPVEKPVAPAENQNTSRTSTAAVPVLPVTKQKILDALAAAPDAMKFHPAKSNPKIYVTDTFPVMLDIRGAGSKPEAVSFRVGMAEFVQMATVDGEIDQNRVDSQIRLFMHSVEPAARVIDERLAEQLDVIAEKVSDCMAEREKSAMISGRWAEAFISRVEVNNYVMVSVMFVPLKKKGPPDE